MIWEWGSKVGKGCSQQERWCGASHQSETLGVSPMGLSETPVLPDPGGGKAGAFNL